MGASRHYHHDLRLIRSAPVPGGSNVNKQTRSKTSRHPSVVGACCARGRAHSGGSVEMGPQKTGAETQVASRHEGGRFHVLHGYGGATQASAMPDAKLSLNPF